MILKSYTPGDCNWIDYYIGVWDSLIIGLWVSCFYLDFSSYVILIMKSVSDLVSPDEI